MKKHKGVFHILGTITSLFVLFGTIITSHVHAESSIIDEINITIPASCSLMSTVGSNHAATIETGVYQENIGETTFKVFCNDSEGFAVYAVGYTNDEYSNTTLKPATIPQENAIATGTATSGETSNWAMKLTAVSGDFAPTLETGFNTYHVIPELYTKVASFSSNTDATNGSSFKSTYGAYISGTQLADSYTGKVKYTVIHPANAVAPITPVATMQNMSSTTNPNTPSYSTKCTNEPSYVIDSRDDHVYTVQRLADGNCWMMENLDLGRKELTVDLTSENTNLRDSISAATFNSWIKSSGTGTFESGELIPLSPSNTINGLDMDPTANSPYGTLYNYCAASAGTSCNTSNSSSQYDICPAGWRLPNGDTNGEFHALYNLSSYNTNAKMRTPIENGGAAFTLAGYFNDTTPKGQGSVGRYWSSTLFDTTKMYLLILEPSDVRTTSGSWDYIGNSIRCILKEPKTISNMTYLQKFNLLSADDKATVLNSMEYNTTYSLIDIRDDHSYAIAKLKDGKIWMVENLDLGRTAISNYLNSYNTNLSTYIAASTFNSWKKDSGVGTYDAGEFINVSGTDATSGTPYGTLYNYYVASAGEISGDSNNNYATSDICPAGWRLPTGGNYGELQNIYAQYNSNLLMRAPIENGGAAFALSGRFSSGNPSEQGIHGWYWSSTILNSTYMFRLHLTTSDVEPSGSSGRFYGLAIRCIAK